MLVAKNKIVWLTPYPVHTLQDELAWGRKRLTGHPCSWIINLANALGKRGDIDLHLVHLCPWVSNDQILSHPDGYTLHVLKAGLPVIHKGIPAWFPVNALSRYGLERKKLVRKVRELNPDVVHAHGTEYAYGLGAMDAGFPWVVSLQGIINDYLRTNPCLLFRFVAPLERQVLKGARFVGGRTHYDKGYAQQINPTAVILDLPEAINTCFFAKPWSDPDGQRILFVGSDEKRKGLHRLIYALGLICDQFPGIVVDAVGRMRDKQRAGLLEQAKENGVKLNFLGFRSAEEIARLHRESSLFVIPSENENSPNTLAEAMASGMPVIAYDVGGISSMVEHEVSGLLVSFGDEKGLSESLSRMLRSADLRKMMGANAGQQAERNRPDRVAEITVNAYLRVLREWPNH